MTVTPGAFLLRRTVFAVTQTATELSPVVTHLGALAVIATGIFGGNIYKRGM